MRCFILIAVLLMASCKGVKEWEQALTWKSPTNLCTGRLMLYPELVKLKQGPLGSEEINYGAELSLKLEC